MTNSVYTIINALDIFIFFDQYYINRVSQMSVVLGYKLVAIIQAASTTVCVQLHVF